MPTKHYLCSSGKLGMLKPHYSPSCGPQGPAGIFSPPDCPSANLLPFGKAGTQILKDFLGRGWRRPLTEMLRVGKGK